MKVGCFHKFYDSLPIVGDAVPFHEFLERCAMERCVLRIVRDTCFFRIKHGETFRKFCAELRIAKLQANCARLARTHFFRNKFNERNGN